MLYMDVLAAYLDQAVLAALLEEVMQVGTYEPISDLFRRHRTEGRRVGHTEGLADAVLTVLETRGLAIPPDVRTRVATCTDSTLLHEWLRRATLAVSSDEIFDDA